MSCQIQQLGNIQDVSAIRRCLFPADDLKGSDSWLQLCEISASPTGDLIVIANERYLVVLTSKWDSNNELSQFHITYSDTIHEYDKVKAVVCLPIVGISQNSHVGPDWTCILIGYDSGFVRFYTENCEQLFEEQLHNEKICTIKCQSQHNPRPDISPELHPEEIYIQYQSNVSVLNGVELFQLLRTCRSQLASGKITTNSYLTPRKWGFQDQNVINDTQVVGLNLANTFDHLLTASTCGGFETKFRTMPPHNTLVLAAGSKPFVGYHYALEGAQQPVFSDVAKAVATKLKSALPSWLIGNNSSVSKTNANETNSIANQPVDMMGCRFGLCDLRRTATNIILSSDRKLAAICDTLGRVLLIDSFKGIVLKIFKGYRDAQCSFIQVKANENEKKSKLHRVATFLVIYSSKKGTLEIFTIKQGMKVTTFTASKFSRLLYINYGLMGFQTTTKSRYICSFSTIFIDNDGKIKEIQIPFHYALTEKNSKRSRDIHLYKKLRQLIKNDVELELIGNEALKTCTELKTIEIQLQTVEMLLNSKNLIASIILPCLEYFLEKNKELEGDENKFKILVENAYRLVKFYMYINETVLEDGNNSDIKLNLDPKDLQKLHDLNALVDNTSRNNEMKVTFSDFNEFNVVNFISLFDLSNPLKIHLKSNMDDSLLFKAAEILYKQYLNDNKMITDAFKNEIVNSKIVIKDLFILLINYWVNKTFVKSNLENEMIVLSNLLTLLVDIAKYDEDVIVEYNNVSKFWSEIREILVNLSKPFPTLTAAILCKFVAYKFEQELDKTVDVNEIEVLSQENCLWTLLIGKLEDVSLLNIILSTKPSCEDCSLPKLKHDSIDISLKYILKHGKGCVSELVAKWLTLTGINPNNIVNCDSNETIYMNLNQLRTQFPYSLEASPLLANMCWEYALHWQKDIQNMELLEACLKCSSCIPNEFMKRGLYNLLWNTHLKILFENISKLINKVGKLPKERLCRQDTGLTDYQVTIFIGICLNFLDTFMDIVQECCNLTTTSPILNYEPIWDSSDNNQQPLIELAVQQRDINYDLLHLHYQLCLILQMITTLSIKYTKPINNLFESNYINYCFMDFQTNTIEIKWHNKIYDDNSKLKMSRIQFLYKIIKASLETVVINETGEIYSNEHVLWMSKCLLLARFWNLDCDQLKCYQVVQLFACGFDILAEELLPAVNDMKRLGEELLVIGAKRMVQFLTASPDLSENISALSPALTQYLDTLNGEWCEPSSLDAITNIATHTVRSLNENQNEYKLAQLLLQACFTLKEIQS